MNKVILIGRLTRDPELRYTPGTGTAVARFSLAINRSFKKNETDFINCVAFGKTAETITQYLTKGRMMAVTGSIRTGSYDAQDGSKRYTFDVAVDSFEFVDSGNGKGNIPGSNNTDQDYFNNSSNFSQERFNDGMEPCDDGDLPF